jgi:hypothetical protein
MRHIITLLLAISLGNLALAELPSIRFDRIYPLGLAAGGNVEIEINGGDDEGLTALRFDHPGLSAELIAGKERWFKITAAADVPAGTYDVRLLGRFGVSNSKLIGVQRGLTEVLETEPNNELEQAQAVAVNSVVNGNSDGENVDRFRFAAKTGQRIVLDVDAQKLDSQLDAQLVLLNSSSKQLASSGDYNGRDSLIDFVAPADGEYVAVIHDLSFRGNQPYRLMISDRPHAENVFPRAIQRGQTVEVTALGRNLGGEPAAIGGGEAALESAKVSIAANAAPGVYTFLEHPTDHSALPTAATCRLDGMQVRPTFSSGDSLTAVPMLIVDSPVSLEAEPNDAKEPLQPITLPAVVNGRFELRGDADWFEFTPSDNANVAIDVYSERLASQADPYVVIVDEQGNRMQEFDDAGARMKAFDGHVRDPSGTLGVQKDKKYRVLVQDRYQRGGPRFQYVLAIRKVEPGNYVAAIHRENPQPAGLNIRSGGAMSLDLVLHQRDGQNSPVTIVAENLPPGLHAMPTVIPNDNGGVFVLWCDEGVAPWTGALQLFASYQRDEQIVKEQVRPYTRVWNDSKGTSRPTRELAIAIRETAPFCLIPNRDRIEAKAGDEIELKMNIKRLWPEFSGELKLLPLSFPGNFQMPEISVPAGANEAKVALKVQNGTAPGEYTLALQAQGQVPFNKDPATNEKANTLVTLPSRPFVIVVAKP